MVLSGTHGPHMMHALCALSIFAGLRCMCLQAIRRSKPPAVLADSYPLSEYRKTQAYNVDKW